MYIMCIIFFVYTIKSKLNFLYSFYYHDSSNDDVMAVYYISFINVLKRLKFIKKKSEPLKEYYILYSKYFNIQFSLFP